MKPHPVTYDHIRCATCGAPWTSHSPDCSRHPYRPGALRDVGTKGALAGHLIEMMPYVQHVPTGQNGEARG